VDGDEHRIVHNPDELQYELWLGEVRAGVLAYRREPDALVLTHTEIDPALRGRGLGSRLVAGVLEDLRRRGLELVPVCPFIVDHLRRHPEQQDLVARGSM
jgi:predicted GNAT family acetyltransferase